MVASQLLDLSQSGVTDEAELTTRPIAMGDRVARREQMPLVGVLAAHALLEPGPASTGPSFDRSLE